jgi:hypothetical protein
MIATTITPLEHGLAQESAAIPAILEGRVVSSIGRAADFGKERQSGNHWLVGGYLLEHP